MLTLLMNFPGTIDRIDVDNAVKVVIITGAGERAFCAGADIAFMVNINPIEAEKYASSAQMVLNKIEKAWQTSDCCSKWICFRWWM